MGIFAKIKKAWFDTIVWETIDDEFYDELEDSLIMADLGATVAHDAVKKLRDVVYQKSIQRGDDVKQALRDILIEKLNVGDTALDLSTKPSVVLVIGVNGVGKTTSIGKIAHRLKGEGKRFTKEAAMAKLFCSEHAMLTTTKALQMFGGYGYTKDYPMERMMRDAKITEIYEGTSEVQRIVISANMGL